MKKIIYLIITIFMIILFSYPLKIKALEDATFYLQIDKDNVIIGDEFEVSLNLKGINTSAYSIEIFFDTTKLEFISGPENSNVIGNKVKIIWYDSNGGTEAKQGELEKLKFKAIASGTADFDVNGEFFDENTNLIQTDFENFQIEILVCLVHTLLGSFCTLQKICVCLATLSSYHQVLHFYQRVGTK